MRMILSGTASAGGAPDPVIDVSIPDPVAARIRNIPEVLANSGILESGVVVDAFSTYREALKHVNSTLAPEAAAQALMEAERMNVEIPEILVTIGPDSRMDSSVAVFQARDPYVCDPLLTYESEMVDVSDLGPMAREPVHFGASFLLEYFHDASEEYVEALRKAIAEYGQDASPSAG